MRVNFWAWPDLAWPGPPGTGLEPLPRPSPGSVWLVPSPLRCGSEQGPAGPGRAGACLMQPS